MAVSLQISDELKARVKAVAKDKNRTPHWIMCEAIRQYVESYETAVSRGDEYVDPAKPISAETVALIREEVQKSMSSLWDSMLQKMDGHFKATPETRLPFDESIFTQGGIVTDDAPARRLEKVVVEKTRKLKSTISGKPEPA